MTCAKTNFNRRHYARTYFNVKNKSHFQVTGIRNVRAAGARLTKVSRRDPGARVNNWRECRLATGLASPRTALPDPPSNILSFLHDTHDLFYYFYFSLIILLNGLFRCSMKLLKFPFRTLLAHAVSFPVSHLNAWFTLQLTASS